MDVPRLSPAAWAAARQVAEPLRPGDLTMLASDVGPSPMNMAAVLLLDGADGSPEVPETLAARAAAVPRLGQLLVRHRHGAAWVPDPHADPRSHVIAVALAGGGERAVLDEAARLLTAPLDPARPLWTARWLTGWDASGARRGALVVVLHHTLADGIGGLAVLRTLADDEGDLPAPRDPAAPVPPTRAERADRPSGPGAWRAGLRELGVLGRGPASPRLVARTSLNLPTGAARRLDALAVPLDAFREGAHRLGGTVNDAMVAAVAGALARVLAGRGEHPGSLVVSVPVSERAAGDHHTGNATGAMPVAVPSGLDLADRVRHVAAQTSRRRAGSRGRSSLPLGGAFRALGRAGLLRPFIEHQRMVHTFETNVRGPSQRLRIAGHDVSAVVPAATNPGNVGASFAVLSYAGELVVAVATDPRLVPEPSGLAGALADELAAVTGTSVGVW